MESRMVFRGRHNILWLVCVLGLVWMALHTEPTLAAAAVHPQQPVKSAQPAGKNVTFWVIFRDKADLSGAKAQRNWVNRGHAVVQELQNTAASTQANVRARLKGRGLAHRSFWIANALKVTADQATMKELSKQPEVESVLPDRVYSIPKPIPTAGSPSVQAVEWNISEIRAPAAWSTFGARGDDIIVANIDTGVQFDHPALVAQYRGNLGGGAFRHDYNWYDPTQICGSPSRVPCDNDDHGTHTMGTMVGDDGGANRIGVAPGAKWIAVKGCETNNCSTESLLAAGEWLLAPTDLNGANPRPDMRPHVVNNSWGGAQDDPFYRAIVDAWIAAGIFPSFSNGNEGPDCSTAGSPGDYAATYSSGAFGSDGRIADFSSRGPSLMGGTTKPNVAAPGVDIRSSVRGGGYASLSGTSMASPHTTATVALIWSAAPSLIGNIPATRALLDQTAINTADASCGGSNAKNNVWGEGRLDAFAAVEAAPRGPVGSLLGRVTNSQSSTAIAGATVSATSGVTRVTKTSSSGDYALTLPVGSYDVTVSAFGFSSRTFSAVNINEAAATRRNAALSPAPRHQVFGYVRDQDGRPLANARVEIADTPLPPARTDATGYYSFANVPQGTYNLTADAGSCNLPESRAVTVNSSAATDFRLPLRYDALGYSCRTQTSEFIAANNILALRGDDDARAVALPFAFPFYGRVYDTAHVSTNGFVSFSGSNSHFINEVLPTAAAPNAAIYAMWDDLNVDDLASVRTRLLGTAPNRQFVIEWRNVAFCCEAGERLSFEIVLFEDGRILTQYDGVEANDRERGISATIGIEDDEGSVALQYAFSQTVVTSGLAVLYNAPPLGFIEGTVRDAINNQGLAGATVRALQNGAVVRETTAGEGGRYNFALRAGSYTLEARAQNYVTRRSALEISQGATVTRNVPLNSARVSVAATALAVTSVAGRAVTKALQLSNTGRATLEYSVAELPVVSARGTQGTPRDPGVSANNPPAGYKPTSVTAAFIGADALLLMDARPWDTEVLQTALEENGVAFDLATSREMSSLDLSRYRTIFIAGDQPLGFYVNYSSNLTRFSKFVDAGGQLWISAGAGGWNNGTVDGEQLPGGIVMRGPVFEPVNAVANTTHPTMQGMDSPFEGSPASLTSFANLPKSAKVLSRGRDTGLPTAIEYGYGSGRVVAFGQPLEYAVQFAEPAGRILENSVPYANNYEPAKDITWLSSSPVSGTVPAGATQSIRVAIDTRGLKPGLYRARLQLRTNDPTSPRVLVPITLTVPAYEKAVDAGGSGFVNANNFRWEADRMYSPGEWGYFGNSAVVSNGGAIARTADDALYQTLRQGMLEYRFDNVPQGVYEVNLRFAEIINQQPDSRVIHILVEGEQKIFGHDIALEVGSLAADNHRVFARVTDGQLNVRFLPHAGSQPATINALRVTHRPDM